MLSNTRVALFRLRDDLIKYSQGDKEIEEIIQGSRTDLIEMLRRDFNHDWSIYRDMRTLLENIFKTVNRLDETENVKKQSDEDGSRKAVKLLMGIFPFSLISSP